MGVAVLVALGPQANATDDLAVRLTVKNGGFEPTEIQGPPGERMKLEITNGTGTSVEFESFELDRERVIPPGKTVTIYVSGLETGRYEFFDDFNPTRRGALVIK